MKQVILLLSLLICVFTAAGQAKDSAYVSRVEDRAAVTTDFFYSHVPASETYTDTVAYINKVFAHHIETIRLRTDRESNRKQMYAYAIKLHNNRLSDVLPEEVLSSYQQALAGEIAGFTFCPVCSFKYQNGQDHCSFCGEALP